MTIQAPSLGEIQGLGGRKPKDFDPLVAALTLDASGVIASMAFWWPMMCGYRWGFSGGELLFPGHAMYMSFLRETAATPTRDEFWRGPIPASVYAALAVVRSGGDPAFVRTTGTPTAGIFALPLESARVAGFNPWAVFDSLRFVRAAVEVPIRQWVLGYMPAPRCPRLGDFLYAALFNWLTGSQPATWIFALLAEAQRDVTMWSVTDLVGWGEQVDWSHAAFRGTTKAKVREAAESAKHVMLASQLVEGFSYAWQVGADSLEEARNTYLGALPRPPVNADGTQSFSFGFPTLALSDPERAARQSVVDYPNPAGRYPAAILRLTQLVPALTPWEKSGERELERWGADPYQVRWLPQAGHYPTRHVVLASTVPGYLSVSEGELRVGEEPREEERTLAPGRKSRAGASMLAWAGAGVAGVATLAALYWWLRRRGAGGRGVPTWRRLTT